MVTTLGALDKLATARTRIILMTTEEEAAREDARVEVAKVVQTDSK